MFENKITFCACEYDMVDVWPRPQSASRVIPDEYKRLEKFKDGNMHNVTVKSCMPFLDALTLGYIIFFDQDYIVDPVENDLSVTPAQSKSPKKNEFEYHSREQLPKDWEQKAGEHVGKFHNRWLIKTPPGYSCLFIKPMNRIEDRFEIISGVVDTDTYISLINFPFILNKRDEQFMIKKGDPMVQVIPFKREPWKSWSGFYKEDLHTKTDNQLLSKWYDKYKKMFWNKKSFK
jgi:hypothetical protein